MTKLHKLHKGAYIFHLVKDTIILLSFLVTMVASVYTLQFLKEDKQLKSDYADCMQSLQIEVQRNDR